jgi:small subunit ribosomal protein S8
MSQTDPIADMLTAVRNASQAGKPQVDLRSSRFATAIAEVLKQEGFIQNWRRLSEGNPQGILRIYLKYTSNRRPILRAIRRVSKPGLRIYVGKRKIPKVFSGIGVSILSTPVGVLTGEQAKAQGVGGEVICHVW